MARQAETPRRPSMARTLVIDDDPTVRSVLGRMLRRAGYETLSAADGPTGLQLLQAYGADVAIVDVFMPGHGGLSTITALRRDRPELKILTISGADRAGPLDMAARATAVGADGFLKKPFEAGTLLGVLGTLLPNPPASSGGRHPAT